MKISRVSRINIILFLILIVLIILSINTGVEDFSMVNLLKGNKHDVNIFLKSRLPRLLSVIIVGVSMSICGLIMQTITINKFVSPSTAGTMDWAKLGILIAMFIGAATSIITKMIIGFVVALVGTMLFMLILRKIKFKNSVIVPLIGIMLGNVVSAITSFIALKYDLVQNLSSWMMGSFTLVTKGNYELLYIGIPFMIIAVLYAGKFTIASMGEDFSTNLGLNHKAIVMLGLIIVSTITSVVVVTIGTIPFIGLIVPNIVSMYVGDNLKKSLLTTSLLGSILVLVCDIISRIIIYPYEVSISVIMSVIGSILFLLIIFRKKGGNK